jgi:ribosomal protein S18 acetylase RimI-like enzyme
MKLQLRPALETDRAFCESLHRSNMASYLSARGIVWNQNRFLESWTQFDNFVVSLDDQDVGLLRMLLADGALEIRDLQVLAKHRDCGIGAWAVAQAKSHAESLGLGELRLRVFADNPAQRLYTRLGFKVAAVDGDVVHMSHTLPPGDPFEP